MARAGLGGAWGGVVGAATCGLVYLLAAERDPSVPAAGAPHAQAATALQLAADAGALLRSVEGTPPVACELLLRSLDNRWGEGSVRPRVHVPLSAGAEERSLAQAVWEARFGAESVGALGRGLGSADPCERRVAARLLGTVDAPSVLSLLRETLAGPDAAAREAGVFALAYVQDPGALPLLEEALRDRDLALSRAAAWALGHHETPRSIDALLQALRAPDELLRENAAWALGRIESREAVEALSAALSDASVGVRVNAAWALGQIEDPAAIPVLASLLGSDQDDEVRKAAAWALGQIDG